MEKSDRIQETIIEQMTKVFVKKLFFISTVNN